MRRLLRAVAVRLLAALTRGVLAKYQPTVVAVAGSVGKTTTRRAIYVGLQGSFFVWEARHSLNSEFGVPLAVFGLPEAPANAFGWWRALWRGLVLRWTNQPYPELLVLEFGEDHPGDLRYLCDLVRPQVGVVTSVAPAHLKEFKTVEAVTEEMRTLLAALPSDGFAVLNADDPFVAALATQSQAPVALVGFSERAEIRAHDATLLIPKRPVDAMQASPPPQLTAKLTVEGQKHALVLPGFIAPHQIFSALAAIAVGRAFEVPIEPLLKRLRSLRPFKGRMRLLAGVRGSLLIDDSYNSSPRAVEAALDVVKKFPTVKRRIVVLGVMNELGEVSGEHHVTVGHAVGQVADRFVVTETPGIGYTRVAHDYGLGARSGGMAREQIVFVPDAEAAGAWLKEHLRPRDLALIKGSQVARLEKAVAAALAEPDRASELLVRQNAFWQRR